jgi:phosphotransferase system HPr (HPr) family protein
MLLKMYSLDVRVVRDGHQAIASALLWRPDFILLDLGLPGMDCYQVAARLRHEESCQETVIIAVTGYGRREDRQQSRARGIDHHLVKPVDLDGLLSLLSRPGTVSDPGDSSSDGSGGGVAVAPDHSPFLGGGMQEGNGADGSGSSGMETAPYSKAVVGADASASTRGEPFGRPIGIDPPARAGPPPGVTGHEESPMLVARRDVEVTNAHGLHLRAAQKFVRLAYQFRADVRVACDGRTVSGRSMLDLMTLAAPRGSRLELEADGPDAAAILDALADLIGRGFDEPDR